MSHVLMAWELGANMGHIDRMLITARAMRARGHEVTFALKDLARAHARVVLDGFPVVQSPLWLPRMVHPPKLVNFSAVLAAAGWLDGPGLAGLLSAWRSLFDLARPDLLVCDHAPTAMLAMRRRGIPVAAIGNSFELPPHRCAAFPSMSYWDSTQPAACERSDALVLAPVNKALALTGDDPLPRLTALFDDVRCLAASLPEFMHYASGQDGITEVGPSYVGDSGIAPEWPAAEGRRVFAYLSPEHDDFEKVMAALRSPGIVALVHAKGLSADAVKRLSGPALRFTASPVKMDATVSTAEFVISHASIGTVTAAALAGRPQLTLPNHMEQYMMSRRMVDTGIGLAVEPGSKGNDYGALLRKLMNTPAFATAAAALAQRHRGVTPADTGERIARELSSMLG